jgi:Zn-dependent protease with chaperone function
MKLDTANRSFLALVATAVVPATYVLCGAFGSVLVPLAAGRMPRDGFAGLLDGGDSSVALLGFLIVVAVSLMLGIRSMRRQLSATRLVAQSVRELMLPVPDTLARTTGEVGLDGRVVVLDVPERFSFAYGALTPRVAISRGLLEGVSHAELRAVLEHERYHVENLDPLKLLLAKTLVDRRLIMLVDERR